MTSSSEFSFPPVTLRCQTCGREIMRSEVDGDWVHVEDYIHLDLETRTVANTFDHDAVPDVIDVEPPPVPDVDGQDILPPVSTKPKTIRPFMTGGW